RFHTASPPAQSHGPAQPGASATQTSEILRRRLSMHACEMSEIIRARLAVRGRRTPRDPEGADIVVGPDDVRIEVVQPKAQEGCMSVVDELVENLVERNVIKLNGALTISL